jgi:hypothetical protein
MNDTETKAPPAVPPTITGITARYREMAPEPDPAKEHVARNVGAYLAVTGLRRDRLSEDAILRDAPSPRDFDIARMSMAALRFLACARNADPDAAKQAAKEVADAWANGDGVGEWLRDLANGLGVNWAEVVRLASTEAALAAAERSDAERAAREAAERLATAEQALARLDANAVLAIAAEAGVVESHERVMYAASVDLARGDADAARGLLWEQLDGFDGEPAGENETGMQYLNRMRDKRKAEAEAKPEPERM